MIEYSNDPNGYFTPKMNRVLVGKVEETPGYVFIGGGRWVR